MLLVVVLTVKFLVVLVLLSELFKYLEWSIETLLLVLQSEDASFKFKKETFLTNPQGSSNLLSNQALVQEKGKES